ncbi:MAG: nicotinamide riboside transporter PnuC [Culturomica sp.]|jgi:nicotinamide mononucleotide transporter|nr:nicotinamide riboside transporter PnuC [Culturomica sp.]
MTDQILEILGTLVGLIYIRLEYRASIYLWITSIIMPTINMFVYYNAGLYADFGINIYYLIAAVYGWLMWKYGNKTANTSSKELPITRMPLKYYLPLAAVLTATTLFIAWILIRFTDSNVPWLDSFTTALCIVAMWMLARKYVEQWWVWLLVDLITVGLYIYKELYFISGLYAVYSIIAIFGYRKWVKMMNDKAMKTSL